MPVLKPVFGVFAVLGWVILLGLHTIWRNTFGWLFRTLGDHIDVGIPIPHFHDPHPFSAVASWLRSLDRNVDYALVHAANSLEHVAVWLFSRIGHFFGWAAGEIKGLALDVEHAVRRLITVTIPRLIRKALLVVWRQIRANLRMLRSLGKFVVQRVWKLTKALAKQAVRDLRAFLRFARWATTTARRHWGAIVGVAKRLKHVADLLLPRQFSNLLATGLHSLGVPWLLATNVKRIGVWVAHLDIGAVLEFVRGAVTFATTTDMCKLAAYQMDLVVFVFEPVMQEVVALTEWFCSHSGDSLPSATTARPGYAGEWQPSATPELLPLHAQQRLAPDLPLPAGVIEA